MIATEESRIAILVTVAFGLSVGVRTSDSGLLLCWKEILSYF
jgi:hypothetical protein